MEIVISNSLLKEFASKVSCKELVEDQAKELVKFRNHLYVMVGSVGDGTGKGYDAVWGYGVDKVTLNDKPITYNERRMLIANGTGQRGYDNQLIKYRGSNYIIRDPKIRFITTEKKQEELLLF